MKMKLIRFIDRNKIRIFDFSPTQIIAYGFIIIILVGALLLNLPIATVNHGSIGIINALFTATSATCVTGLVVVDTNITWTFFGKIVILSLIQVGALGIMSMSTLFALIVGRQVGLKERLTIQESLNEFTLTGVVRTLRNILIATIAIETFGAFILSTRLIPIYGLYNGIGKSIFHSVSAFCNAGFDLFGSQESPFVSLTPFQNEPVIVFTLSFLFIIGGLGFAVWKDVITFKKFSQLMLHTKVVLLLTGILIFVGTIFIFVFEYGNAATLKPLSLPSKIMNAYFQAVTPRTAGFNTLSTGDMTEPSKFLTVIFMFIGAAPGSTGGGVKITTVSVILFAVISTIKGCEDVNILKRKVPMIVVMKSISIVIISIGIVFITTMMLMINKDGDFMQSLFEATSAFGTVGLSTGITPDLSPFSKIFITITMYFGRVGPLSAAIALSIRQKRRKQPYKYPEGRINVG